MVFNRPGFEMVPDIKFKQEKFPLLHHLLDYSILIFIEFYIADSRKLFESHF